MSAVENNQITYLLNEWEKGDKEALNRLIPLVYEEMRIIAKRHMSGQSSGHTFQTSDLIHEAYIKLAGQDEAKWKTRTHFFSVAATAMRHILIDHARSKKSLKRGGSRFKVEFIENANFSEKNLSNLLALDATLDKLAEYDERKSKIVELKFFGGLTVDEIAEVIGVSSETVQRDWSYSRAWLLRELMEKKV
jgi:RNA polymerase sigma-70 factor, ECF subfamily